jgi:hypothetical protein
MSRRLIASTVVAAAVAGLAIVALASARQQAVSGKMTIIGDKGDYRLVVENDATSTGNITCWRWVLGQGSMVTAASRVDGWQLGLSKPAPAPIIAGRVAPPGTGIPPGGKAEFRILTDKTFDPSGSPGTGAISEDCKTDASVVMAFGSPPKPTPPKPKPEPKKCECKKVDVATRNVFVGQFDWSMTLDWVLTCKGDIGVKCQGEIRQFGWVGNDQIKVLRPRPQKAKKGQPPNPVVVTCKGKCSKKPTKSSTRVSGTTKSNAFRTKVRAGQGYTFTFSSFCGDRLSGRYRVYVKFDAKGRLDKKKSDLNGNGVIDADEKKR